MAHLRCISGCDGVHDVFQPLFSCPTCGGLVDVAHDLAPLQQHAAEDWRARIAARAISPSPIDQSGVWAFREWVMPGLRDDEIVTLGEGRTPLLDVPHLQKSLGAGRVQLKQCGQSLTGSFKDLGMTVLVSMASAMKGRGADVRALVCASTGDTSAALAAYGARVGLPVIVLLPAGKISSAQLVQPVSAQAHVLALDGDFDACMKVVQEVCRLPGMFLANSKNPLRLEGQKTVAFEIAAQRGFAVPDFVLVPSGNLGNVAALASGFSLLRDLGLTDRVPRLVACQVDAANPLFRSYENGLQALEAVTAQPTHASAIRIGDPVSYPRAQRALRETDGLVTSVSETDLLATMVEADAHGLFVCPHTAAALAGTKALSDLGQLQKDTELVVVSTAHGLKFSPQKTAFHDGGSELDGMDIPPELAARRNPPEALAADTAIVRSRIEALLA